MSTTLDDLGISYNQASRWQKMARLPESRLNDFLWAAQNGQVEITTQSALVQADLYLREAEGAGDT